MTSIKQDITNRSESVERVYGFYASNRFLVNRRYQRKLVWSIDEKRAFIDSLQKGFPVPLILLADTKYENGDRFEIIDGMQRLNAITSFVEGEFDLDGKFFDLEAMAETKLQVDSGALVQKSPKLDRSICVKIVGYNIPLTIYPNASHKQIDEIFRRINAYGKHLSRQELRVAGVTGSFSQLVRTLAAQIRGDVSASDKLYLSLMKTISITSRDLPYGLNVDNLYWVKNNILTREYIRQSRDEELIADMLGYILIKPHLSSSAEIIDEYFGFSPDGQYRARAVEVESNVSKVGLELLLQQYLATHEALRTIIDKSGKKFNELMFKDAGGRVPRYYQSVFLALWELLVDDGYVIRDYAKAAKRLNGAGENISIGGGGGRFSAEDRETNINVVKGLLRPACSKRKQTDPVLSSWVTEFENILMQSQTEQALYDFKQGFCNLDGSGKVNEDTFTKIFKTLAAMANHNPGSLGYIIVGVTDDEGTATQIESIYKCKAIKYQNFYITGVEHEAAKRPKKLDGYFQDVIQRLSNSGLSSWAKSQIARDIRLISYFGHSLLIFKVEAGSEPCDYEGKYYERHGANVAEILQTQFTALFKRFLSSKIDN